MKRNPQKQPENEKFNRCWWFLRESGVSYYIQEGRSLLCDRNEIESSSGVSGSGGGSGGAIHPVKLRRVKYFKRQSRVHIEDVALRKQASEPAPAPPAPPLLKHESYPQYSAHKNRRVRTQDHEVGSLLIRAVTVIDRQSGASTSTEGEVATTRASHTPAVRSGPPLSCNFCWNTVDECGRILRRKTQYHCPECRTNLCIVPCFHEYHDGPEAEAAASAR